MALGGGRVIDAAKAIAGADGLRCAAVPTTLSGAEMTPFHRMPAGVDEFRLVRPALVIADPGADGLPADAGPRRERDERARARGRGALHAARRIRWPSMAALRAAELIAAGLAEAAPTAPTLALGAVLAGYASGLSRLRRPPRRLPDDRARLRDAARADQRGRCCRTSCASWSRARRRRSRGSIALGVSRSGAGPHADRGEPSSLADLGVGEASTRSIAGASLSIRRAAAMPGHADACSAESPERSTSGGSARARRVVAEEEPRRDSRLSTNDAQTARSGPSTSVERELATGEPERVDGPQPEGRSEAAFCRRRRVDRLPTAARRYAP